MPFTNRLTVISVLLAASAATAQSTVTSLGDAAALVPQNAGKPTKAWTQWQPKPTYALADLPDQYMGDFGESLTPPSEAQTGWNRCAKDTWNQGSKCQTAWVNSIDDWCIWGPDAPGDVGSTERSAVAYCTSPKHGTRLIPDGTVKSAHFVKTSSYVQVTGEGDFTSLGIPAGDEGGEMDSAGADDLSNPIGGVLFTTANPASNGKSAFVEEWTNFMSHDRFCIRACWGDQAAARCQHIYDVLGCLWNIPANYGEGFESCDGDLGNLQGIYDVNGSKSTFYQGQPVTPQAHPAPASSNCQPASSVSHGLINFAQANGGNVLASEPTSAAAAPPSSASTPASSGPTTAPSSSGASARPTNAANNDNGAAGMMIPSAVVGLTVLVGALLVGF